MSAFHRSVTSLSTKVLSRATWSPWSVSTRSRFGKARIPPEHFEERAKQHDRFGGDPEQPHKLHIVTRVKSVMRRPYWERDIINYFGLKKAHVPVIHKNTPAVNSQLKFIKHLVKIQPLKTPHGLPSEEEMADAFINSKGELIVPRVLKPAEAKAIES